MTLEAFVRWLPTIPEHLLFGALAVLAYVISTRAGKQPRSPATAIAWVMGLALMPYVVLPMYLMFGRRKLRPTAQPRSPRDARSTSAPPHWAEDLLNGFGLAPPSPCDIRLHTNGAEARAALLALIAAARTRLDICTFIIGNDRLGNEVVERLAERARAGVEVRVLLDGFGALMLPRRHFDTLRQAGGQVTVFRPLLSLRNNGPRNLRNHRKLVIADDCRLWSGGRNLAAEYFEGDTERQAWIDLSYDLQGAVATAAAHQFELDWTSVRQNRSRPLLAAAPRTQGDAAQFLPSGPDQAEDTARALLIDACFRAERSILAATPYFIPDDGLRDALRLAARRGVAVTIVMPARSNHVLADFARTRAMRNLAAAGVEFRLLPRMSHAKAVVVDDSLALGGSINLDLRSLLLNHEASVVFYGAPQIDWIARWVSAQAAQGRRYEATPPSLLRDVAEGLLLTVAFQL